MSIEAGKEYFVVAPFVHSTHTEFDFDGGADIVCWRPGVVQYQVYRPEEPEVVEVCAAEGSMVLVVLAVLPLKRPFATRVVYYREWIDPDGKRFGGRKVRMTSLAAFNRIAKGWQFPYEIDPEKEREIFEDERKIPF